MSKILVFDSQIGIYDTAGQLPQVPDSAGTLKLMNEGWDLAVSEGLAIRTYPVRIHSAAGEITIVDWEFYVDVFPVDATVIALRFFQEFYNDDSGVPAPAGKPPALVNPEDPAAWKNRDWPGVNATAPWSRELVAVSGGGGVITMTPAERRLALQKRGNDRDSVRAPLSVYGRWVRLGMWVDIASSTSFDSPGLARLKIFAHVGGHSERKYLHENGNKIYAYTAFA